MESLERKWGVALRVDRSVGEIRLRGDPESVAAAARDAHQIVNATSDQQVRDKEKVVLMINH